MEWRTCASKSHSWWKWPRRDSNPWLISNRAPPPRFPQKQAPGVSIATPPRFPATWCASPVVTSSRSGASRSRLAGAGSELCGAGSSQQKRPRGRDGGMGQSGRVRRGGRESGQRGWGPGGGRSAHLLPLAPAVPAPEAGARPGAPPQPRGLCRTAALFRVLSGPRGSQRTAAQPGLAAGHGAAHRHPPAGLHRPAHLHPLWAPSSVGMAPSSKPREASVSLAGERSPYGDHRGCLSGL